MTKQKAIILMVNSIQTPCLVQKIIGVLIHISDRAILILPMAMAVKLPENS